MWGKTISGNLQYSKLCSQKAYGFSVSELTSTDTFRLDPADDGATAESLAFICGTQE